MIEYLMSWVAWFYVKFFERKKSVVTLSRPQLQQRVIKYFLEAEVDFPVILPVDIDYIVGYQSTRASFKFHDGIAWVEMAVMYDSDTFNIDIVYREIILDQLMCSINEYIEKEK